jgi:type I restriction enzyme S subunit
MHDSWRIAAVPEGWSAALLLDRVALPSGQVDPRFEPYASKVLVAPDHIESGTGRLLGEVTAKEQGAISGKYLFQPGDVVYSKIRPYLRKAILAHFEGLCSADMYPLRSLAGVHPRFLLALVLGEHFSRFADIVSMRSGFPKINRQELREYTAAFPGLPEQTRIAEILDSLDEVIHGTELVVAKLRQVKQGLIQDLLTRGIDNDGGCPFIDAPLGALLSRVREQGVMGLPLASVTLGDGLVLRSPADRRVETSLTPQQHLLVKRGDIAYNMMRMWQGACGLADADCLVSPAYVVLRMSQRLSPRFAYRLFKSPPLIAAFLTHSRGITSDRFRLYPKDLLRIRVSIPEGVEAQERIADVLDCVDQRLATEVAVASHLRSLKQGVMEDLLTGRVRLSIFAEASS